MHTKKKKKKKVLLEKNTDCMKGKRKEGKEKDMEKK